MTVSLFSVVSVAFQVYSYLIIFRILLSWIRHNPYQPIIRFIYEITEPYLSFFRKIVPPFGPMDFSPIVALFALFILERVVLFLLQAII